MNAQSAAKALIRDCELQIRSLMETCLSERRYEDLPALAGMASTLSKLADDETCPSEHLPFPVVPQEQHIKLGESARLIGKKTTTAPVNRGNKSGASKYPIFERQGDRLIKVGWSKKERSAYEHRVQREIVFAAAAALITSMTERGSIRMDAILPLRDNHGSEVPSYQAYLVLAWLRELGVVLRKGNDGYGLAQLEISARNIEQFWSQTPERQDGQVP